MSAPKPVPGPTWPAAVLSLSNMMWSVAVHLDLNWLPLDSRNRSVFPVEALYQNSTVNGPFAEVDGVRIRDRRRRRSTPWNVTAVFGVAV